MDNLKILSFNIEGLASGLDDPNLLELMYKQDICLLQETWKRDETKINIPGWWDFSQVRPKHKKAGRHSGGVSILCKDEHRSGVKIEESAEGFIWVKLDAKFFNLNKDLFLCAIYIPPQYSENKYAKKTDYYDCLNKSIMKYSQKGNILLAGDLNSRVGSFQEEIFHKINQVDELCPNEVEYSESMTQRLSCDNVINAYGKKLLKICKSFDLKIVNGNVPGDRLGSFTCYNTRGSSVVDYFICDKNLFNIVTRMNVHPPQFNSIHAPISIKLDTQFQIDHGRENNLKKIPKIKWDESKARLFRDLLNQDMNLRQISVIENKLKEINLTKLELDECTKSVTSILYSNAKKCFKVMSKIKKRKIPTNNSKTWFSKDCISMRKRLTNLSKLLLKSPNNASIRGSFLNLRRNI